MSVTFKDVAQLAKVSTQTVSRVTNGSKNVAAETRKRVFIAIEQLGYVPNKGAQILARAKSKFVGVITVDILHHGASNFVRGIHQQSKELDHEISLSLLTDASFENVIASIKEFKSLRIEFIIINVPLLKEQAEQIVTQFQTQQFIFIDIPDNTQAHSICADHFTGAIQAANLMLTLQKKHILLLSGPKTHWRQSNV